MTNSGVCKSLWTAKMAIFIYSWPFYFLKGLSKLLPVTKEVIQALITN